MISGLLSKSEEDRLFIDSSTVARICGICHTERVFYNQLKWEPRLNRYVCTTHQEEEIKDIVAESDFYSN